MDWLPYPVGSRADVGKDFHCSKRDTRTEGRRAGEVAPNAIPAGGRGGGTRLAGGHESINGAGGAVYLPTVGRNTLRLPDTGRFDLRVSRAVHVTERVRMRGSVEIFNLTNRVNYSAIMQRAFLVGTETNGVTPLIFQNAATVATEGLNVRPFGTFTAASTGQSPERQVQLGVRVEF